MTKEELIRYGNDYYRDLVNACCGVEEKHKEFVRESIKALEQHPVTTTNNNEPITVIYPTIVCDDAISRQAVLDLINDQKDAFYSNGDKCLFESYVNELPSATPKQKYGKWIKHPEIETSTPEYLMFYECSECGDKQCFCKSDLHKKRFCNSCGAKMQESEDKK